MQRLEVFAGKQRRQGLFQKQRMFQKVGQRLWLAAMLLLLLGMVTSADASVQYTTTADWGTGFNGQIVITNTGAKALSGWTLEFDFTPNITSIWDASVVSHVGKHYTVKSAGWNDTIAVGDKVSFGFGGAPGNISAGPQNFVLNGTSVGNNNPPPPPPPAANGVQATITQTSAWGGGFTANLDIVNGGAQAINGWALAFQFTPTIQSLWSGVITSHVGNVYTVKNEVWNGAIAPGGKVTMGFTASGTLAANSGGSATLNGAACTLTIVTGGGGGGNPSASSIVIGNGIDNPSEAAQITIAQNVNTYPLSLSGGGSATYTVSCNNPSVVTAQVVNNSLQLRGLKAGRAGLRLQAMPNGVTRYVGVRVRTADGQIPGFLNYLAVGSVSEDTDDHLNFWHSFDSGLKNRYVDARYIYLNGGPYYGWTTWTNTPGDRARNYIRESKKWA